MSVSFFTTPEFYVILAVLAAAIVIFAARPDTRGPASEHLLPGVLADGEVAEPMVHIVCLDDGKVALMRRGLPSMTVDDAVSLAIKVIGTDVTIEERLTFSRRRTGEAVTDALFILDFLPQGRYHIRYNSDKTGMFAAFPLHVRPGLTTTHELKS